MLKTKLDAENILGSLVDDLLNMSRKKTIDGNCDYSEETILALSSLKEARPVLGIKTASSDQVSMSRKSNVFGGYPYTSEKFPWPLNEKNDPYYPLVQINLKEIGDISGKYFGTGLLQIWLDITKWDLPNIVRVIGSSDLDDPLVDDVPDDERVKKLNEFGSYFGTSLDFSFYFMGFMLPAVVFDIDTESDRRRSVEETEIIGRIEGLCKEHGYESIEGNWLLGYPDRGSGTPAGRYYPEPLNLIQFATVDVFPMVGISRYGNVFYSEDQGEISYFFDWNG
jgi:hypothetical protein